MEVDTFEWQPFLTSLEVVTKNNPFGLPSVKPGSLEECHKCSEELKIKFPTDFFGFTLQIGPGTLGRVRIFGPQARMSFSDPRMHTFRLKEAFTASTFKPKHKFPMHELITFANDVEENLWFGWKESSLLNGDTTIYCFDEHPKGLPPTKVAYDLKEFITHVCLGVRMQELGLKRYEEPKDKPGFANRMRNAVEDDAELVGDEDDDWTSSEEEGDDSELKDRVEKAPQHEPIKPLFVGDFDNPFKIFKPFSQGLN